MKHYSLPRQLVNLALMWSLLAVVAGIAIGCQHQTQPNNPPAPTPDSNPQVVFANTLLAGARSCDLVATLLVAADQTLDGLQASEPDYYAKAKPLLAKVAKANDAAIAAIRAAKAGDTAVNWQASLAAVGGALNGQDLTVFGFKNPQTQKIVSGSLSTLQLILGSIAQSYGGGK